MVSSVKERKIMCGIFGSTGHKNSYNIVREGLLKLAYRGYDSAGIASSSTSAVVLEKTMGHPEGLPKEGTPTSSAIGHNRWATHGKPSEQNAHPHMSMDGSVFLVHNGIIENHLALKEKLSEEGYHFYSETDTEVIPNLIEREYKLSGNSLKAIEGAIALLEGSFAIVCFFTHQPLKLFVAKKGSPLVLGATQTLSYYISSDKNSLPEDTFLYADLPECCVVEISAGDLVKGVVFQPFEHTDNSYRLDGYKDYMSKEIASQESSIPAFMCARHPCNIRELFKGKDQIIITGCGSALYASQMASSALEARYKIPVRVLSAGELQYDKHIVVDDKTLLIAVSQSGETADTLRCVKKLGLTSLAIHNTKGSSLDRSCNASLYIEAGQEISVASTKAVTHQAIALLSLAYDLRDYAETFPLRNVFLASHKLSILAKEISVSKNLMVVARGTLIPSALETALKIKEICYIHAEGMSASEFKHGPLALIDEHTPTLAFVGKEGESKIVSNIQEIKARSGMVYGVVDEKCSKETKSVFDYYVEIPCSEFEFLNPILFTICGQLINYHIASILDVNVDRPRNLAKSVTTE